ncbi:hypothetical protein PTRA_a3473 [Pseudoalteromonas translucida KMM 520]|uniref:DUF2057 domain-containing protein n=1 Tax=Pseudoalteromonas translucida KMM 520 TaxID=1315283 RepID=A0A0U2WRD6_9GAMM|nr:DUF2057 family protein [Pseudoalteromonas translucida]ALS34443.1 hypothetical protein PTRA_a3473 [Pseudoalteromonas translucida KMM 520]
MRKSILLGSAAALLFSVSSMAENIHFPEEFVPLQVGERIIESSIFSRVDDIELAPGSYKLKLKYTDLYDLGYDDHEVVESEPFWVNVTIEAGKDYILEFNRAKNAVAAKVFAQSPQVSLKAKGSALAAPLSVISNAQLTNAVPVQQVSNATAMATSASEAIKPVAPINGKGMPSAAAMLDFWWQQATPAQQQAFLEKVTK